MPNYGLDLMKTYFERLCIATDTKSAYSAVFYLRNCIKDWPNLSVFVL